MAVTTKKGGFIMTVAAGLGAAAGADGWCGVENRRLRRWVCGLFALPVLLFLWINLPLVNSTVRGEHWMLLYRYVEDVPLAVKLKNIALFAFPGVQRPQFLAFFVPYIPFWLFGVNFTGYFFFSLLLHVITGMLIVKLLAMAGTGLYHRFWAFSLFVLSYLCLDVVNWTFFSYVQLDAILVLASTYWLMRFLDTKSERFFHVQALCLFISCFIYEISISVFFIQLLLFALFGVEKKYVVYTGCYVAAVLLIVTTLFGGLPNESDAYLNVHLWVLYRCIIFIKNLLVALAGLYPLDFEISNIVFLKNAFAGQFFNPLNLLIVGLGLFIVVRAKYGAVARFLAARRMRFFVLLNVLILAAFVAGLCFARVPPEAAFDANTYLDSQPRYYYLPVAIMVVLLFSLPRSADRSKNALGLLLLLLVLAGNCLNSSRMVEGLRPYYADSWRTVEVTKNVMRSQSIPDSAENFIKVYVYAWVNQIFPVPQHDAVTADFIYNTDDMWLSVLPREYDAQYNKDVGLLFR